MVNLILLKDANGWCLFYDENLYLYYRTFSLNDVSSTGMACPRSHSERIDRLFVHDQTS
ncbi:MAG: hypothetical protein ABF649_18205 [Bacillus sp. (in: firmicutes)]